MSALESKERFLVQKLRKKLLGQIVEDARKKANMTQMELANRIGADKSYISRIENGKTDPKVSTFFRIMNAIGCKIEVSTLS